MGAAAVGARREPRGAFWAWAAAVLLVGSLIGGLLMVPRPRTAAPVPAQIAVVTTGAVEGTLVVPGRLEARSALRVGAGAPGQVVAVTVSVGDRVRRGQVLARLDDLEQRRRVAIEDAQLALAQIKEVQAEKRLVELALANRGDAFVPRDLDLQHLQPGQMGDAQLAVLATATQLRAQGEALSLAKERLGRRVVRAPLDGIILESGIEAGETVGASPPGPPLFVIAAEPSSLVLRAPLDEDRWPNLRSGPAAFRVRALGDRSFGAAVRPLTPAPLDGGAARPEILLDVAQADRAMRPGMSALVELPMRSGAGALRVPLAALTRAAGDVSAGTVTLVDGQGRPHPTPVAIGVVSAALAEIRGPGLSPGARVLVRR
jgi:macrolide-specific efflux system membrane fusion protein